jgi:hypothetical protein
MDYKIKKQLLERYWRGETTVEEERWLKENIASLEETKPEEKAFFDQLGQFADLSPEMNFDLDYLEKERLAKTHSGRWAFYQNIRKIAAAILVLVTLTFAAYQLNTPKAPLLVEEEDPQKAFEVAKQSLLLISAKLNKGADVTYELENFELLQEKMKSTTEL